MYVKRAISLKMHFLYIYTEIVNKVLDKKNPSGHQYSNQSINKFGSAECTVLSLICSLYQKMFTTMKQMKYDILSGKIRCITHILWLL